MASINGAAVDYIHGRPSNLRKRIAVSYENGVNGYYAQELGDGGGEFEFRLVQFDEKSNIYAWVAAIEAIQGNVADIVNDESEQVQYALVTEVDKAIVEPAGLYPGLTNPRVARVTIRGVRLQPNDE